MADTETLLAVLLPVIVGLALITIANLVARNGRDHRHSMFFAALYFLSGLKSMSEGLAVMADQFHMDAAWFPETPFWVLLGNFCAFGMLPLLFLFVVSFPRPLAFMVRQPRKVAVLAFVPSAVVALLLVLALTGGVSAGTFYGAASGFNILFFAVNVVAIVLLLRTRTRSPDVIERTQATYVLIGFLPAFVTGWAVSGLQLGEGVFVDPAASAAAINAILHFISPVLELAACCVVGFAILKYNLLGINPRFRLGVKSVLAGALFVGFFLLTQYVENEILQGKVFSFADGYTRGYGSFILSGATSLVLFKPIEKVSGRVSDQLLPGAAAVAAAEKGGDAAAMPAPAAATLHAEQIYHAQCTYVLRDAHVTEREMALLRNLRVQLGLGEEQARRIEQEVEQLLKVDAPQTGASAPGTMPAPAGTPSAPDAPAAVPPKDPA